MKKTLLLIFACLIGFSTIAAAKEIALEKVNLTGRPFMQAFEYRASSRNFTDKSFDITTLSELLWAAGGVNRPNGGRTYPTAMDAREIEIYVFDKTGAYLYDPENTKLVSVAGGDKRADTGVQDFVAKASINLVYVSDFSKLKGSDDNQKMVLSAISAGAITQNVALYCASRGLGNVVRASFDGDKLSKILKLGNTKRVVIVQSAGYTNIF